MEDKIIPFGKHKGKPVEVLASDKQYLDWLIEQSWFKEKHINLYNVVINNFREPSDTPEHNRIQIKFLKLEYRIKLAYLVNPNLFANNSETINKAIHLKLNSPEQKENNLFLKALANPNEKDEFGLYTRQLFKYSKPVFEKVDVSYSIWYGSRFYYKSAGYNVGWIWFNQEKHSTYSVEIKPTISDDFPAILRQMKASMPVEKSTWQTEKFYILLLGNYTGTGATQEEFVEYFGTQGYRVVFENEIENLQVPEFDKELKLDKEIEEQINTFSNLE